MENNDPPPPSTRLRGVLSSWNLILIFGVIYVLSQATLYFILQPMGSAQVFRLQTTLSPETFSAILEQWREADLLGRYAMHYYFDFVHPLWYALFLSAMLAVALDANDVAAGWNAVLWVPFLAGALDLVENLVHVYYLTGGHPPTILPVMIGGLAAIAKWTLVGVLSVAVIVLGTRACFVQPPSKGRQ